MTFTTMTMVDSNSSSMTENIPKTMADALDCEDPYEALMAISRASSKRAQELSDDLAGHLAEFLADLPEILASYANDSDSHPITTAVASADSILNSLSKIASGGSQASQEIRQLEQEKRDLEEHAQDVETALVLRKNSDQAAEALSAQNYAKAATAVKEYMEQKRWNRLTTRALEYAGEYSVQQMETTQKVLRTALIDRYEEAVQEENLRKLGEYTPLLPMVDLEKEGVAMYLRYLQSTMMKEWEEAAKRATISKQAAAAAATAAIDPNLPQSRASKRREEARQAKEPPPPPYIQMAHIYNCAVTTLRHHLPMVSHCLHKAEGDAAVIQLVHVQVEQGVGPIFQTFVDERQLNLVARNAQRIYALLEARYSGRSGMDVLGQDDSDVGGSGSLTEDMDDCGFSVEVGTLADVDAAMEEAALCLQHTESYARFIRHTVNEVNKAREIRYNAEQDERRMEQERQEWATGMSSGGAKDTELLPYKPLEILPAHTQLHEVMAEVGGYYSGIERCLLLASMQRAFSTAHLDPFYYSSLGAKGHTPGVATHALKTSLVETCLYAARRGTQRAFATGHTGTASAMANFCSDCLTGVLMEFLSRRAEELGVARLKPGEGLLEGSAGIFNNASNLIRQGTNVGSSGLGQTKVDEATRRQRIRQGVAQACATLNDLEVAVRHTEQLEAFLSVAIDQGYPPSSHDTELLRMCVKSLGPVAQSFKGASNRAMNSLVSILTPRVRSMVGDALGLETSTTSSFMSSSVMGKGTDRNTVRMNYDLDEEAYQMLQLGEGYMARL
jgi:hypothetical protein